jgi:hypothetical protein
MQPVTESQQRNARYERMQPVNSALDGRSNTKKDILQTHPIEKRNENNVVGQARNDVIE